MSIFLTGIAGFIGFHTAKRLLEQGYDVIGLDNLNDYYDVNLKYGRLHELGIERDMADSGKVVRSKLFPNLEFIRMSLENRAGLAELADNFRIDLICHLAAQAGVRYSLENPYAYINSNVEGFLNILELARKVSPRHLVYASSSSVYGLNKQQPFSVLDNVDHPISFYAVTKKSNELMAHCYSHLHGIPTTGLRFFTVYGPWGRPDMALFLFTKAILEGKPIDVFNNGNMLRDFTYIDDIVEGVVRVLKAPPVPVSEMAGPTMAPYRVYNIGNGSPINLLDFVIALEKATGHEAMRAMKPLQPGDLVSTWADTCDFERDFSFKPETSIRDGVAEFVKWYRSYYRL